MNLTIEPYPKRRAKAPKRAFKRVKKEKTVSRLTKDLDAVFSRFVRLSNANVDGNVQCFTCPHFAHYKKIHAGHYISRYYKLTRWEEKNVKPQCFMCNIYRKGNAVIFRRNLVKEYGEETILAMEATTDILVRGGLEGDFLREKIAYYQALLITLKI